MKRRILYLVLLGAIALTGCRDAQTGNTEGTVTESQSENESESEAVENKTILVIRDENKFAEAVREQFYEDENYTYYFAMRRSDGIYVYYTDGTKEKLVEALESGRATIEDMKEDKIAYYKVLKIVKVVDLTKSSDIECVQEREFLYSTNTKNYYLDCQKSMYIELYYENGTVETLREALDAGRISSYDLNFLDKTFSIEIESEFRF